MEVKTPQSEVHEKLNALGWVLGKISFKGGKYVAKAKNPQTGQSIERQGSSPEMALVAVYQHAVRAQNVRREALGAWQNNWYSELHEIAKEYAKGPEYDKPAIDAWNALAAESKMHAQIIQHQITVELVSEMQPYESPKEMIEDVNHKQHLLISSGETNHPAWSEEKVIDFRIAHDVLGICQTGGGWSWPGANRAVMNHMPHLSELAQEALFTEVIGRTAYETVYRGLGGPKVFLLTDFLEPIRKKEGIQVQVPKVATD